MTLLSDLIKFLPTLNILWYGLNSVVIITTIVANICWCQAVGYLFLTLRATLWGVGTLTILLKNLMLRNVHNSSRVIHVIRVMELWLESRQPDCRASRSTPCCCSFTKSCLTLCNPIGYHMPGFPVSHYLPEFAQTHTHWINDAIQPSHPLSPPSPPALFLSQHQGLFQWVCSSHQVAKV